MRRWLSFSRLPLAIGALIMIVPWFYLTWNTTVGELVPNVRFRTKQTIAGVFDDAAPEFSLHSIRDGTFQRSISLAVGMLSPVFKPALHWKNQIYYTLLGTAGTERVIVGRDKQLIEMTYVDEYCSRNLATFRPRAEAWAQQLRALQDAVEARGKAFLYVVTPSKISQQPDVLPDGYTCPADPQDRTQKMVVYDDLLRQAGVRFVDTGSILPAARAKYGIDMFPRGGIHWNMLGAAVGTQAIVAAANAEHLAPPLPEFDFTWTTSYKPSGSDRDLLDILNLPYPDTHYLVPEMTYRPMNAPAQCRRTRVDEIGGSFLAQINDTFMRQACPPEITYWFYWDKRRIHYLSLHSQRLPVVEAERHQSLENAEIIILEENEAALPTTEHARALMKEFGAASQ